MICRTYDEIKPVFLAFSKMPRVPVTDKLFSKFIVKITTLFRKLHRTNNPDVKKKVKTAFHPKSIPGYLL